MLRPHLTGTTDRVEMPATAAESRRGWRRSPPSRLERRISQVDRLRRAVVRRPGIPRGTPDGVLVQKVLERMMIDELRRIAL